MKRLYLVIALLVALSTEAIAHLDVVGGSPPGCC